MKKSYFPFIIILLFTSCADEKSKEKIPEETSFSKEKITAGDFDACEDSKCPEITVYYLKAEGENKVSEEINKNLEKQHAKLIISSEEQPVPETLKTALESFIAEYKQFKKDYPESSAEYEISITDSIAYQSDTLLVVKTSYYIFKGGAHGYGATNFLTFNKENGKQLNPKELFTNLNVFKNYSEEKFREKFEIPKDENINSTGFFFENDTYSLPNNLAILEDEVVLIYNPYEAANYASGEIILRFPKEEVEKWLRYE